MLVWRALDRTGIAPEPEPAAVAQPAVDLPTGGLIAPRPENTPGLLDESRRAAVAAIGSAGIPHGAVSQAARLDLADAFRERLGGFLMEDFDRSVDDLIVRGWPSPDPATRARQRAYWESHRDRLDKSRIDPTSIEVRVLDPGELELPALDPRTGFSESIFGAIPIDTDGRRMTELGEPDDGLVEIRLPAEVPSRDGVPTPALLGYRFTWDTNLNRWRWIQTCLYHKPEDGPLPPLPAF